MKKLLVGNWKMTLTATQALELAKAVLLPTQPDVEVVLCPSFVHLSLVKSVLPESIKLGAQNVSRETWGAFTGEICAEQLKDMGCEYVIVGHSERRLKAGESSSEIGDKLLMALAAGLKPILCIGESLEEYQSKLTAQVIKKQLSEVVTAELAKQLIIAYEPIWAIGSGLAPSADEIAVIIKLIHEVVAAPVLYGGSVNSGNAALLKQVKGCQGFLVGGASLKANEFNKLL